ncbi:sulfotransferase domain-containing protein [Sphingomonas desiccabilis]|uniref:Sulfotransferase domain-containing protein n=1 Tax=Sphingomonas desiccabilis TaxID=429134 RepID=A0A4Q2IPY6_9SPHN|nr:sulfotransferase domain-containing protein [Sphingomonas desiccabilis]MBB3911557.1 hypothetical protein [Sphingomonas desiccabilis]RXZ31693.1 hypothetical protein EO081_10750 [Sphingomonas desiccabilis]
MSVALEQAASGPAKDLALAPGGEGAPEVPPLPIDFLVLGAQKCGTTWIHHVLSQHPEVFIPPAKELHFFNKAAGLARGRGWYAAQFADAAPGQLRGECTPNYLWNHLAPEERPALGERHDLGPALAATRPGLRLVATLRNPVDRAVSAFHHHINQGRIAPDARILDHLWTLGIASMGMYARHLRHWFDAFGREPLLVLVYEADIAPDRAKPVTAERLFAHLGIAPFVVPSLYEQRNARRGYLAMRLARRLPPSSLPGRAVRRAIEAVTPQRVDRWFRFEVSAQDRAELAGLFAPYQRELEELLDRRMPW